MAEFSANGFTGGRIDAIAAHTNSNKALIYHYFGSKEGLYLAVLEAVYADIRKQEDAIDFEGLAPDRALAHLAEFTFQYYLDHPAFVRIINNENLHYARFLKQSRTIASVNVSIIDKLARILRRGAEAGMFRPGLDPVDTYISISALGFTYVANQHTLGIVFGRDLLAPAAVCARKAVIAEVVLRFVAITTAPSGPAACAIEAV